MIDSPAQRLTQTCSRSITGPDPWHINSLQLTRLACGKLDGDWLARM